MTSLRPLLVSFLSRTGGDEIVLEAVVVAIAEKPNAELLIVEQKPPEIELERLDSDAQGIEVVAVGNVAEVVVDEGFLHADEMVEAAGALRRVDEEYSAFGDVGKVRVERERQPVLDVAAA